MKKRNNKLKMTIDDVDYSDILETERESNLKKKNFKKVSVKCFYPEYL